jgi:hypothetical protein
MKIIKFKIYVVLLVAVSICATAAAQPKGYKINMELNADEKGTIEMVMTTKYNAQYWDYMKAIKAMEPSILKNNMKRQFPKYELTDFDVKSDDMERTSSAKFKIHGLMKLDDNGKWIADLDTKDPDITKVSDTKFLLVDESTAQTMKINLPSSASGAKVEKDNFGKAILTYTAPVGGGMGNILQYLGIALAAGGAFLFFKNRKLNTLVVNTPQNKKIDYSNTKHIDEAIVVKPVPDEKLKPGNQNPSSHSQY